MVPSFQQKYIYILSAVAVLTIITLSFVSYREMLKFRLTNDWVIHSHNVIEVADNILFNFDESESKQRGYLLTDDIRFFNTYKLSIAELYKEMPTLVHLTKDNPDQNNRVKYYESLISKRIVLIDGIINIRKAAGITAAANEMKKDSYVQLIKTIRLTAHSIIDEEKRILSLRNANAVKDAYRASNLVILGDTFSLILILFCFYYLNKHLSFRVRAENKIQESEDELLRLAYYDTLTGVASRSLLIDNLEQAIRQSEMHSHNVALLFLDVDKFKDINDTLGHETGDELLKLLAKRLNNLIRGNDTLSRLGGDEFLIVLTEIDHIKQIAVITQKILDSLSEPFVVMHHNLFITASIGISIYPHNGTDAQTLMKNADIAMYRAKDLGKNNYQFCTPKMSRQVKERILLEHHLHQAILHEEFDLLYQPKILLKNEKMTGVEALIRWNRPQEVVLPSEFISLAEGNGLIIPIGEWMLRTACLQGKKWQDAGLPLFTIAVNFSTRQIDSDDFVLRVKNIIREMDFDSELLEFEITESALMENSAKNIATLHALKDMGIKIAIDDFGTGYSSLSYLRHFAIDKLKIDKSFIKEIVTVEHDASIINAIIAMAHSLGMHVIAEGVETKIQHDFLQRQNCDEAQGYYYSSPISSDKISKFISL